jgi:hypothetical protein
VGDFTDKETIEAIAALISSENASYGSLVAIDLAKPRELALKGGRES